MQPAQRQDARTGISGAHNTQLSSDIAPTDLPRHGQSRRTIEISSLALSNSTHGADSWIEVSSQPSSSSLHSLATNDVVTTTRAVTKSIPQDEKRLRQLRKRNESHLATRPASVAGSSQDEYEESESESDRVMSSSNEEISNLIDEDEDASTALGIRTNQHTRFTPQPHAFSRPAYGLDNRSASEPASHNVASPFIAHSERLPSNRMITQRTITQRQSGRGYVSASQPDHDAALRASLTTLLSCAAAVRPKEREASSHTNRPMQPTTLRLVSESQLHARTPQPVGQTPKRPSRESSKERQAKKIKAARSAATNDELMSPTLMAWMISAGVVLVFSAISFSAGYAWGREVGYSESSMVCDSCAGEAIRASPGGLRKLRWSTAAHSARA